MFLKKSVNIPSAGKGTDEVISAGCTIAIGDFVSAIEKAYNAAAESDVTAADTLKVTAYTSQTNEDATADKDGKNQVEVYVFGAATNANGKIVAVSEGYTTIAACENGIASVQKNAPEAEIEEA